MESNGKQVTLDGSRVDYDTGPVYLGRTRHQRAALLLSADSPGHAARSPATSSGSRARSTRSASITICWSRTSSHRAKRWRSARPPTKSERRAHRTGWCRTGRSPETGPSNTLLLDELTPASLGTSDCALRAHRLHCRAPSGRSTRSINGVWSWARCWPSASCPSCSSPARTLVTRRLDKRAHRAVSTAETGRQGHFLVGSW